MNHKLAIHRGIRVARPMTLEAWRCYYLIEKPHGCSPLKYRTVRFITYGPSPAFVIILDSDGKRRRWAREDLWAPVNA